jgi:GH24 family phage-related lysozyme (muramidase)
MKGQAQAIGLGNVANTISAVGQTALDADEGFARAALQREQQANIDAFLNSRDPDFQAEQANLFQEAAIDLSNLRTRQDAFIQSEGIFPAMEQTAPEFASIISRLKAAEAQGVMTKDELEMRVLKTTREAINRRPGLAQELTQHAEQTLNLSGARQVKDFEDKFAEIEAKRQAESEKLIVSQALKHGLKVDLMNPNHPELNRQLMELADNRKALEEAEFLAKQDEATKEANKELALQRAPSVAHGLYQEFSEQVSSIFPAGATPTQIKQGLTQMKLLGNDFKAKGNALIAGMKFSPTEAAPHRQQIAGSIDSLIQFVEANETHADLANLVTNQARIIAGQQDLALREKINVPLMRMTTALLATRDAQTIQLFSPQVNKHTTHQITKLLSADINGSSFRRMVEENHFDPKQNDLVVGLDGAMRTLLPREGQEPGEFVNPGQFETVLTHAADMLIDPDTNIDALTRVNTLREFTKAFQGPDAASYLKNASAGALSKIGDLLDQNQIILTRERDKMIARAEDVGAEVSTNFTPDGRVVFNVSHNNPGTQREFQNRLNNGVGNRINELTGAFATHFGLSKPETVEFMRGKLDPNAIDNSAPKDDDEVTQMIKEEEGFREDAYLDDAGVPTIGYGFTRINGRPVELGDVMSREDANQEVKKQIQEHSNFKTKVEVKLSPEQERALSSFEFNLGSGIWNTTGKPIIAAINAGDLEEAANIMKRHNKARDPNTKQLKELRGLTNRRKKEADLLLSGLNGRANNR